MSGTYKNKAYPLRIEEEVLDTIKGIAKLEDRKANKQIERILKDYIAEYIKADTTRAEQLKICIEEIKTDRKKTAERLQTYTQALQGEKQCN